ncbi:heme NO-binding domain-containing protein [Glaciimonas immobilis]|uniref:Heme NO-binding domain-containing protein n=1 Tax=Glaciimonas immobilis TaxID=728004 RepID=A0A840RLT2_9BURK|nr:heme NO-binding domain-containing protein [Glaciimonas immobilis]KAF3999259.1 hypothetical protein HAV38_04805 [Glaciimonas immobilis]MBB5198723.1 hypothetical protein [Glaciimonas immobilis]
MKGIIFQDFVTMMETLFSVEVADEVMSIATLETAGAYTSVGSYDHIEIVELVGHLSAKTGISKRLLLCAFGKFLFASFMRRNRVNLFDLYSTFSFLSFLDKKMPLEVKELYLDQLPSFDCLLRKPSELILIYCSKFPFSDIAEGVIRGAISHFNEVISISRLDLSGEQSTHTQFTLKILNETKLR